MKEECILGIRVQAISRHEAYEKIEKFVCSDRPHYIVTLNPEMLLAAQADEEYFYILNNADLSLTDGFGLQIAGWMRGINLRRVPGSDLTDHLLRQAADNKTKVAVINWNGSHSSAEEIKAALLKKFAGLNLVAVDIEREWTLANYPEIESFRPELLLVSLGLPYQEKFIFHFLPNAPYVRAAIGVGGTFDFYTGRLTRAPQMMRTLGLEWLWRLKEQPRKRWKRIVNATIKFPLQFIKYHYICPWFYRPNVSCLLYKKIDGKFQILIVERTQKPGHWQLPQGGRDGMSIEDTGIKELSEEINTSKFKPIAVFPDLWKYKFINNEIPRIYKRQRGYKGQKQSLFIAEFIGEDREISVNYWDHLNWKWVDKDELPARVHPDRRPATELFLHKFNETIKDKNL